MLGVVVPLLTVNGVKDARLHLEAQEILLYPSSKYEDVDASMVLAT